jgi:hypothetical protein
LGGTGRKISSSRPTWVIYRDLASKKKKAAVHQWLLPVIPATQDADQEDHSLKPTPGKKFMRPYLKKKKKKKITKKGWWSGSRCRP